MSRYVSARVRRAFSVLFVLLLIPSFLTADAFPGWVYERVGTMAMPDNHLGFAIAEGPQPRTFLLFGGAAGSWSPAIRRYSITTNSWEILPATLPYPYLQNERFGAARASNGRYYLSPGNGPGGWGEHDRIIEFDPINGAAVERAPVVTAGFRVWGIALAAAPPSIGGVYMFGGWNGGGLADVRHYDPATDTVTFKGSLSMGRTVGARVAHPNGRVYLFGGNQFHSRAAVDVFDSADETVRPVPNPLGFAFNHGTLGWAGADNQIYLWNPNASDLGPYADNIIRFDPGSETFSILGPSLIPGGTPVSAVRDPDTADVYTFGFALPGYVWGVSGIVVPDVRRLGPPSSIAGPILLSDGFDDGLQVGWKPYLSGWSEANGYYSARNTGADSPVESVWQHGFRWGDYAAEADIRLLGGYTPADAELQFRYKGTVYVQGVEDNCKCSLFQFGGTFLTLITPGGATQYRPISYTTGEWKRVRATAVGNSVTCEIVGHPDTKMFATTTGSLTGTVALRGTHEAADFDNVLVTSIGLYPQIVFRRNGQIWIMRTDGSNQTQLTSGPDDHSPRLRNGVVTFIRNRNQLYRTDTSGTTPTPIANTVGVYEYDLSPDASEIVITYLDNTSLFRMQIDGSNRTLIHQRNSFHQIYPSFARNGFLYFGQSVVGNAFTQSIYRIPPDASLAPAQLVPQFSQFPRFGMPSNRVVYVEAGPRLRSMRPDGTDQQDIPGAPIAADNYLGVDEETNHVYFASGGKISKIGLGGSELTELTTGEAPVDYGLGPLPAPQDSTPPSIVVQVSGTLGDDGWYTSDVTVQWVVTDDESAISVTTGCALATLSTDTASAEYTCTATSGGGTSSESITVKRDATAPSIVIDSPAAHSYGLQRLHQASYSCGDALSGVATCAGPVPSGGTLDTSSLGEHAFTVSASDNAGNPASVTVMYHVVNDAYLVLLDRDAVGANVAPNDFSRADINEDMAGPAQRSELPHFAAHHGEVITLHSGHLAGEGWFAPRTIPASWAAAGPTSNGAQNFVQAGPGLGSPDARGDVKALLQRVPDMTALRATGLQQLVGQRVFAVAFKDNININYAQGYGDASGKALGVVAFEVLAVTGRTSGPPNSLPAVTIRILDATAFGQGLTRTMTNAPVLVSPTAPADLNP